MHRSVWIEHFSCVTAEVLHTIRWMSARGGRRGTAGADLKTRLAAATASALLAKLTLRPIFCRKEVSEAWRIDIRGLVQLAHWYLVKTAPHSVKY